MPFWIFQCTVSLFHLYPFHKFLIFPSSWPHISSPHPLLAVMSWLLLLHLQHLVLVSVQFLPLLHNSTCLLAHLGMSFEMH